VDAGNNDRQEGFTTDCESIDEQASQRNRRLTVLGIVGAIAASGAIGLLISAAHPRHDGHRHGGLVVATSVLTAVAVIGVIWALWLYRRPAYRRTFQYGWRRRNRVGKALRRGNPIAEEDLAVARSLVEVQRTQRWIPPLFGALAVGWLLNGLAHSGVLRWSGIGLAVVYVVLLPVVIRQRRRISSNYARLTAERISPNTSA